MYPIPTTRVLLEGILPLGMLAMAMTMGHPQQAENTGDHLLRRENTVTTLLGLLVVIMMTIG
jgi:hypothetical protein